jgi:hypothetical protein
LELISKLLELKLKKKHIRINPIILETACEIKNIRIINILLKSTIIKPYHITDNIKDIIESDYNFVIQKILSKWLKSKGLNYEEPCELYGSPSDSEDETEIESSSESEEEEESSSEEKEESEEEFNFDTSSDDSEKSEDEFEWKSEEE